MEYAQQFIQGLDSPASLTFMGLMLGALLLGMIPAGLTYAFRVRDLKKRLAKHIDAHQRATQERLMLEGQLERHREQVGEAQQRIRQLSGDRATQAADLTQLREELSAAQADALAARVEAADQRSTLEATRNKLAGVQGKLQSLQAANRPQAAPSGFDLDMMASLKTTKTKLAAMEQRVEQLTQDNEKLRRELAS